MSVVRFSIILTEFLDFSEEKGNLLAKNGDFGYNRDNKKWCSVAFLASAQRAQRRNPYEKKDQRPA
ncbi:MAG: hypothetical protein IKI92_02280, partial [Anaerotignum sp.]|nr:hypothetical protein [Anaerotignum sp.]